jgi:hypothetical protein
MRVMMNLSTGKEHLTSRLGLARPSMGRRHEGGDDDVREIPPDPKRLGKG